MPITGQLRGNKRKFSTQEVWNGTWKPQRCFELRYFGALAAQLLNDHPLDDDMFMYIHPPGVKLKIHTAVLALFLLLLCFSPLEL